MALCVITQRENERLPTPSWEFVHRADKKRADADEEASRAGARVPGGAWKAPSPAASALFTDPDALRPQSPADQKLG